MKYGETENSDMYNQFPVRQEAEEHNVTYDPADEAVAARLEVHTANIELQEQPEFADTVILNRDMSIDALPETMQAVQERWSALTNVEEHIHLKKAIMRHLNNVSRARGADDQ